MVKAIPEGYHSVTPYLVVNIARATILFYKYAFEPREIYRHRIQDGKSIINAELKIGDSIVFCQMSSAMVSAFHVKPIGGIAVTLHITLRM
jgi:PhnB protein